MAIYAIGDIQGCYDSLMRLLDRISFNPNKDILWIAGDLVNRGSNSLATLRFLKDLEGSAICVLGNHDISLLAIHYGIRKSNSTLDPILQAHDREEIINWLRHRPLLHVNEALKYCMAHAGVPPQWSIEKAQKYSLEIQQQLQADTIISWLSNVYGDKPKKWKKAKNNEVDRHRYILNAFTRMRFLHKKGALNFKHKSSPHKHKKHIPWYAHQNRKNKDYCILFGHWASLGYHHENNVIALDTGCVWGGQLTAVQIDIPTEIIIPISISC